MAIALQKRWPIPLEAASSQKCPHRNSVQNGPIEKFTALEDACGGSSPHPHRPCHALWGMIGRKFRRELHLMIDFVASANRLPKSTPRGPKVLDFRLLEGPGSSTALQAAQKGQRIKLVKPLGSPSWPQVGFQVSPGSLPN